MRRLNNPLTCHMVFKSCPLWKHPLYLFAMMPTWMKQQTTFSDEQTPNLNDLENMMSSNEDLGATKDDGNGETHQSNVDSFIISIEDPQEIGSNANQGETEKQLDASPKDNPLY